MPGHDKHEAHRRLVARLRQQAEDVRRLTADLSDELLGRRVVPGKWSLKELACHLWRVQQVFADRIQSMLSQEGPAIMPYDPEEDPEFGNMTAQPGKEVVAGFLDARERFAEWLVGLSPGQWHRRGAHPEFPHYDVHFQVEYMVHHEAHHLYQMFQRRSLLGKMPH